MKSDLDYDASQEEKKCLHKIIYAAFSKKKENPSLSEVLESYDAFIST